ncbi:hypothetical protein DFJ74DRAFT_755823, partial [Hyaloraphidium curvatum]
VRRGCACWATGGRRARPPYAPCGRQFLRPAGLARPAERPYASRGPAPPRGSDCLATHHFRWSGAPQAARPGAGRPVGFPDCLSRAACQPHSQQLFPLTCTLPALPPAPARGRLPWSFLALPAGLQAIGHVADGGARVLGLLWPGSLQSWSRRHLRGHPRGASLHPAPPRAPHAAKPPCAWLRDCHPAHACGCWPPWRRSHHAPRNPETVVARDQDPHLYGPFAHGPGLLGPGPRSRTAGRGRQEGLLPFRLQRQLLPSDRACF